ncbi:MAG TPA: aquaporin [Thermoleophilaceae bacterium]|nr:aquaporin [Thermoleophilaceae bacterium]
MPAPPDRGPSAYIAEFIGTFGLVLFVTLAVSLFARPTPPAGLPQEFIDWSVIGLVHVFVLFMLIQTLAIVSGAHFNPAVTVALAAIREIKIVDAAIYIVVQLAGATLGAFVTKQILNNFANADAVNYGAVAIGDGLGGQIFFQGLSVELIGTFFLMWAIVGVAVNPRSDRGWAALVIGATLGLAVFVFGPLTGAGLNPARAFGPALVSGEWGGFDDFTITYVLAPVIGAVLAALVYFRMVIVPGKKGPEGMEPVG